MIVSSFCLPRAQSGVREATGFLSAKGLAALLLLLFSASTARAQAVIADQGYYRVGTTAYFSSNFPGCFAFSGCCTAPNCTDFGTTDGQAVNTSDLTAGLDVLISQPSDGEAFTFQAVAPDGNIWGKDTLTYTAANGGCWAWTAGTTSKGYAISLFEGDPHLGGGGDPNCPGPYIQAWAGPELPCYWNGTSLAGTWTLQMYDNNNLSVTHKFSLQHNSSSQVGISSPIPQNLLDNALIDLASDHFYSATDATCPANAQGNPTSACFSATTTSGNSINWQLQLQYPTSYGAIYDPNGAWLTFTTASGSTQNQVYQNEGGQLTSILASTTASDGSAVRDCTTAYVEGPAGGIPDPDITSELDTLYTGSPSYPSDGTGTSNLMTGVAATESTYRQFTSPGDNPANFDLFSLDQTWQILGKWPDESPTSPRGKYIGLMQMQTASNQQSDPNAWNWITNAIDAVNLFAGTPNPNDLQQALNYEKEIISGVPGSINGYWQLQANLTGLQLENMALVLYSGNLLPCGGTTSCVLNSQYYIPQCSGKQGRTKQSGQTYLTCSTGWKWAVNSSNQANGVTYVAKVRSSLQQ